MAVSGTVSAANPTAASHLTTKAYVDSAVTGGSLWTANGNHVHYDGGNVGIGTTSPASPLDISPGYVTLRAIDSGSEGGQINFEGAGSYETWNVDNYSDKFRIFKSSTSTDNTDQVQIFNAGAGVAGLYVEGYVGVGTNAPTKKLHVVDGDGSMRYGDSSGVSVYNAE